MPVPLLAVGAAAARFVLPKLATSVPNLFRAGWAGTKFAFNNPIKTLLGAGLVNHATGGAVGEVALSAGEGAVALARAVPGGDSAVAAAGAAAAKVGTAAIAGLGEVGVSAAKRYGPAAVDRVADSLPPVLTRGVGTVAGVVRQGAHKAGETARDVVGQGSIAVDDAQRAGAAFRDRAAEVAGDAAETAEGLTGGLVSAAELKSLGELAKREATNNKFIMAGLMIGGLSGFMKGESLAGKGTKAVLNALLLAAVFGAIGHYLFGQRSELVETASTKLVDGFNKLSAGLTGTDSPRPEATNFRPQIRRDLAPAPSMM